MVLYKQALNGDALKGHCTPERSTLAGVGAQWDGVEVVELCLEEVQGLRKCPIATEREELVVELQGAAKSSVGSAYQGSPLAGWLHRSPS
ncbi:hypothetical protein NDU88_009400 [Pleurodeles waltl]|uniref:Uncharacterized protein n=1 Tax=Pleurodeles waltl TaxID=8319 RepID=A0AAV7RY97_PLEWA|nr:hypothetical protein NDU88_009400 [Pleurodeles waltl]